MKKLNILDTTHIVPREVGWKCGIIENLHTIKVGPPRDGSRNIVLIRVYPEVHL
jgi:hypothetical protein